MKKVIVLELHEHQINNFSVFVAVHNIWTLFSYSIPSGFFGETKLRIYICITGKDEHEFNVNFAELESKYVNDIKRTIAL